MEAMEVDSPAELQGGGSRQPEGAAAALAGDANTSHIILDSGSSTEVDEDEDDEDVRVQGASRAPPRLPATWAFSQRAGSRAAAAPLAAPGAPIRRRLRYTSFLHSYVWRSCLPPLNEFIRGFRGVPPRQGLRVHYPSQTAAPSRDFPDFLLRAPAASAAEPESGSTTEVSDSDDDGEQGANEEGAAAALAPPASPHLSASVQPTEPQDAGAAGEAGNWLYLLRL